MGNANDELGCIRENLADAGCDKDLIMLCIDLLEKHQTAILLKELTTYRKKLLSDVNLCQSRLESLDYLIYSVRRKQVL